jgi:hypothetical protein
LEEVKTSGTRLVVCLWVEVVKQPTQNKIMVFFFLTEKIMVFFKIKENYPTKKNKRK